MWITLFVTGLTMACLLISKSWQKFQENPVVVTIQRNYNEWTIPKPATIVCPPNVLSRTLNKVLKE